jgi:hypothetical protein
MADEPTDTDYGSTLCRCVQDVKLEVGFDIWEIR